MSGIQQLVSSSSESAALTLYNAGSQIRCFSERTEEATVVDVPLQLEVQEVPAHTEVHCNSTAQMHLLVKVFGSVAAELQVSGLMY